MRVDDPASVISYPRSAAGMPIRSTATMETAIPKPMLLKYAAQLGSRGLTTKNTPSEILSAIVKLKPSDSDIFTRDRFTPEYVGRMLNTKSGAYARLSTTELIDRAASEVRDPALAEWLARGQDHRINPKQATFKDIPEDDRRGLSTVTARVKEIRGFGLGGGSCGILPMSRRSGATISVTAR
jgi:hypothetical protein